jgi:hypothetical protein
LDEKTAIDGVVNSASLLNTVLVSAAALAGIIVILKIMRKDEFEIWHVTVKLRNAWAIFSLFTCAHLYMAFQLISQSIHLFYEHHAYAASAFDALSNSPSLFFMGMLARLSYQINGSGILFIRMKWTDPVTWLSYGVAMLVIVAITQWRNAKWHVRALTFLAALLIVGCNWIIGANWAFAVSELTLSQDQSIFLAHWH